MRRHSRGFSWATKPPTGVLALRPGHPLCPTVSFPFDDLTQQADGASNPNIRTLGSSPLGAFSSGAASGVNAVTWQPTRLGIALQMGDPSNKQYVDAGSSALVKPTGAFTLEVWMSSTSWTADGGIAGSWNGSTGFMLYSLGGAAVRAYIQGTNITGATTLPTDGTLVQLVETYDGATVKLYLNGREDATGAASGLTASAVPFQIGTYADKAGTRWTGDTRYVMVNLWNGRCLPAGDVRQRYVDPFGLFTAPRLHPRGRLAAAAATPFDWYVTPAGPDRTPAAVVGYET